MLTSVQKKGTVYLNTTNINTYMIQHGHAWVYRKYTADPELIRLERIAKLAKVGLWANEKAIPPWEWRKAKRDTKGNTNAKNRLHADPKGGKQECCKICRKGKPCGDSCISRSRVCRKNGGCACGQE